MYTLWVKGVPVRASDRAYATLLEEIQSGVLAPGAVIGEVEQSSRLGVSRTPMREAISRLVADGLVRQQSPRVLVVTGFDVADIRRLFEARRSFEETAAKLAAARGDRAQFAKLATDFDDAHPERGVLAADEYYSLIERFDTAVDETVDNVYLVQALRNTRRHLARARRLARDNQGRLTASVAEHALIARAIADGDAELAAHATHVHLHHALASILASIAGDDGAETSKANRTAKGLQ